MAAVGFCLAITNLLAAREYSTEAPECHAAGLDLGAWLQRYWEVRGQTAEGREWLDRLLSLPGASARSALRAGALRALGSMAGYRGDYPAARAALEESVSIFRELGHTDGLVRSLGNLGVQHYNEGDYAGARARFEESASLLRGTQDRHALSLVLCNIGVLAREQGDLAAARPLFEESLAILRERGSPQAIANTLSNLGAAAHDQGDFATARAYYEESMALRREVGDVLGVSISLINLGLLATDQQDFPAARRFHHEALERLRDVGDQRLLAYSLEGTASLAWAEGRPERAARLWGAAEALREALGSPLPPNEVEVHATRTASAREALGAERFNSIWSEGRAAPLEEIILYALSEG